MFFVWLASDTPGETCYGERDFRCGSYLKTDLGMNK